MSEKRQDIQGLRALAVILVILFHLWPDRLPGGYIGVDVFFVISGYLITAHLLGEVARTGKVDVTRFWARRIRRLLPAAFLVLVVSAALTYLFLPRSLWNDTLTQIAASAVYVQNWVLGANSVDYLAADNVPTLVQHYWSLSIEEQFYLVWPLLIVGALWVAARIGRRVNGRTVIGVVLALVFAVSAVVSVVATAQDPAWAYFATPTRAWEFAAGGLLALAPGLAGTHWYARLSVRARSAVTVPIGWAALLVILVCAFTFDGDTAFPGWIAVLPVAATIALLQLGDNASPWSAQYLSRFGPVQLAGDTSYAIYLWHWPLIVAFPYVFDRELQAWSKIALIAVTIALAVATKVLVEDPVRNARGRLRLRAPSYGFMTVGAAVVVAITLIPATVVAQAATARAEALSAAAADPDSCVGAFAIVNDCADPYAVTDDVDPDTAWRDIFRNNEIFAEHPCINAGDAVTRPCALGDAEAPTLGIALFGDSHAQQLIDVLDGVGRERGWELVPYTKPGCSGFEDEKTARERGAESHLRNCVGWGEKAAAAIAANPAVDIVLVTSRSAVKPATAAFAQERLEMLQAAGKTLVFLRDTPSLPKDQKAPFCVEQSEATVDPCAFAPAERADFLLDAFASLEDRPETVSINDLLCTDDGMCHVVIGGLIVYADDNHLTNTFLQTLAPVLGERLQAAIDRS